MKYYIYQHIRLDTNEIFYIGKGTKKIKGNTYHRAYTKSSRNKYWLNIFNKTPYGVEILEEFKTEEECLLRETELIILHGFSWNNTGTLCNIVKDNSEIQFIAAISAGKSNSKKVYQYSLNGEYIKSFDSIVKAKKEYPCDIYNACKRKRSKSAGGFQWSIIKFDKLEPYSKEISDFNRSKIFFQYDKEGNFIKEWRGTKQPSKFLNIKSSNIRNCLCGISKSAGNYVWKYKQQIKN